MNEGSRSRRWAALAILLAVVGWGATTVCNRYLVKGTVLADEPWPGLSLTVLRYVLVGLLLAPWAAVILWRRRRFLAHDWPALLLIGLLEVPLYFLASNSAYSYASVTFNAVTQQMIPIIGFAAGLLFFRERLTVLKVVGLVVALAGGVLFSVIESGAVLAGDNMAMATMFIFVSALAWTGYLVSAKKVVGRWSPMGLVVVSTPLGAVAMAGLSAALTPFGHGVSWNQVTELPATAWTVLGYLVIVGSVLCYWLYNFALERIEASRVSVFGYLIAPAAMAAACVLSPPWREVPTLPKLGSAAIIILGVWLVTWKRGGDLPPATIEELHS